jgi:hypothetical protein
MTPKTKPQLTSDGETKKEGFKIQIRELAKTCYESQTRELTETHHDEPRGGNVESNVENQRF